MYQPYPGSASMPEKPSVPASVRDAVRLMYAGAVASLLGIAVNLATLQTTANLLQRQSRQVQAGRLEHFLMAGDIVYGLIGAGLWIFVARACGNSRNWARVTGSVLFGVATVETVGSLARPEAIPAKIVWFVIWLIGLGAIVLLWRRTSSAFFTGARS
jgi:hypothetical protein